MKSSPKKGRPTKYDSKTVKAICDAIADGVPYRYAAALAGISYQTYCVWQRLFPEFSDAIEEARAKGIQARLKRLDRSAMKGNPKSDIWYLERTVPEFSSSSDSAGAPDVSTPLTSEHSPAAPPSPQLSEEEVTRFLNALTENHEFAKAVRKYVEFKEEDWAIETVLARLSAGVPIDEIELP
jgi:hypothetical protein